MDFAYGLSQGVAAAAGAAGQVVDQQLKEEAESRAFDRKLDYDQRLMAAQEMMKLRASERFAGIVKDKMGEQVPQEAAPVTQYTADGAHAAGLEDGIQGDAKQVQSIAAAAQATLQNPNATDEQKKDAQGLLEQLQSQGKAQSDVNAKAVEGKTRTRSMEEAYQEARKQSLLNSDAGAFIAGESMFAPERAQEQLARKNTLEEKKLQQKQDHDDMTERTRTYAADSRFDAVLARIESGFGGKNGDSTSLIKNAEYLKSLGYTPDKIEKFIFDKKEMSIDDLAAKLLTSDPNAGTKKALTPDDAVQRALSLKKAMESGGQQVQPNASSSSGSGKKLVFDPTTGGFK